MRAHAQAPSSATTKGGALPSSRGWSEKTKAPDASSPRPELGRADAPGPPGDSGSAGSSDPPAPPRGGSGASLLPIQRLSIPGLAESAVRLHPGARKKLDAFTENRKVRQVRAVLGNLGLAGGIRGKEARYAFKGQVKAEHKWNALFGKNEQGGEGGEGEDAKCCGDGSSPFPKNRHDAAKHDPEANKPQGAPAAEDQTADPQPEPVAPEPVAPEPVATESSKLSDSQRARQVSRARELYDSRQVTTRTLAQIRGDRSARMARRQERIGQLGKVKVQGTDEVRSHGESRALVREKIADARRAKLGEASHQEEGASVARVLHQRTRQGLDHEGVGRESIRERVAARQAQEGRRLRRPGEPLGFQENRRRVGRKLQQRQLLQQMQRHLPEPQAAEAV